MIEASTCTGAILRGNLFTDASPDLAGQFHPTLNGAVSILNLPRWSKKKVWWLGPCGHEWEAVIANRSHGTGCPVCAGRSILEGLNDLATRNPGLAAQWHPTRNDYLPSAVSSGSNKRAWWICPAGHEWCALVSNRSNGDGCPFCKRPRNEEYASAKRQRPSAVNRTRQAPAGGPRRLDPPS